MATPEALPPSPEKLQKDEVKKERYLEKQLPKDLGDIIHINLGDRQAERAAVEDLLKKTDELKLKYPWIDPNNLKEGTIRTGKDPTERFYALRSLVNFLSETSTFPGSGEFIAPIGGLLKDLTGKGRSNVNDYIRNGEFNKLGTLIRETLKQTQELHEKAAPHYDQPYDQVFPSEIVSQMDEYLKSLESIELRFDGDFAKEFDKKTKFVLCENGLKAYHSEEVSVAVGDNKTVIHTQPIEIYTVGTYELLVETTGEDRMAKIKSEVLTKEYIDKFVAENHALLQRRIADYRKENPKDENPESHMSDFVDIPWKEVYLKIFELRRPGVPVIDKMSLTTRD